MQDIRVFDDVISEDYLDFLRDEISGMPWLKQAAIPLYTRKDFYEKAAFFLADTSGYSSHTNLFNLFCRKFSLNNQLIRSYVNCYPPQCSGEFHPDDGDYTFLFFPDNNDKDKGGTAFKNKETVEYKTNRLIVFKGEILHKAEKNNSLEMRHSIAWKTMVNNA